MARLRQLMHLGPLERRLFWIVFVGLLPLTLLSFAALFQNAQSERRERIKVTEDTTRAIVAAVDSELNMSLAALDALAASPRLLIQDIEGFREEAKAMLERRPAWANIMLFDPAAQQIVNVQLPQGVSLPRGVDLDAVRETLRTGKPGVGGMFFSPVLQQHTFGVRVPIMAYGKAEYVLTAAMRPEAILSILKRQRIPQGGVVVILDAQKKVVARSLKHADWVGKSPSNTLLELLAQGRRGAWTVTNTLEGVPVYTVFHQSPDTRWYAAYGIPTDALNAPITRSYIVLSASVLASILIGLFAAFVTGRTVTRPMRELERAAAAAGRGELPTLPKTNLPEIRQAALALASAHAEREKLLQSEREARLLEQEARLAAENASKAKDEFLAMLGHELRNPLAAVTNAAQLLDYAERRQSVEAGTQAKAIIRRQVQHLARLTDDLLDAGRVMMGKINLNRQPVDLAGIVRGALDTLRNTGTLAEHEVIPALEPACVQADATRLDQVVTNLITNAAKYTPPPGTITVSVQQEGSDAVLRVRDTGLGLEPELLPRVFDLFVQGRRTLERSQGGLGIGLTLVRRLTELHGGRVEARSEGHGKGSEFIVRLPLAAQALLEPRTPFDTVHASGPRKFLIVDDNIDAASSLAMVLRLEGHETQTAHDGPAALKLLETLTPEIILLDIGLPGMDGYAVARAIRERFPQRRARLYAITGYGRETDRALARAAGFDDHFTKPIDPLRLLKHIAG